MARVRYKSGTKRGKAYARTKKSYPAYSRRRGMIARMRAARNRIPRPTVAFPRTKLVRHVYYDNIAFPAALGAGQSSQFGFRCNSMFDPNYSGVGHQPQFYDQMAAIYKTYQVIASFIDVTLDQQNTSQNNYKIVVTQDSALQTDVAAVLEEYGASRPLINAQRNSPKVLKASWNAKKWFKTTMSGLMADQDKNTPVASNPTETIYYHIYAAPVLGTVTMPVQNIQVKMVLICMWRDPQDATQS